MRRCGVRWCCLPLCRVGFCCVIAFHKRNNLFFQSLVLSVHVPVITRKLILVNYLFGIFFVDNIAERDKMSLKSEAEESCSGDNKEWYSHFVHEPHRWTDPPGQVNQIFIKSKPMKTENKSKVCFIVMRSIRVLVLCSVVKLMGTVMPWPMPAGMTEQDWSALQGGGLTACL